MEQNNQNPKKLPKRRREELMNNVIQETKKSIMKNIFKGYMRYRNYESAKLIIEYLFTIADKNTLQIECITLSKISKKLKINKLTVRNILLNLSKDKIIDYISQKGKHGFIFIDLFPHRKSEFNAV